MKVFFHHQCEKDVRKWKRAGWDLSLFEQFIADCAAWPLPKKYEAHELLGEKKGIWDIHLRQNWLIFLKKEGETITLLRTGTHALLGLE